MVWKGRPEWVIVPYTKRSLELRGIPSSAGHEKSCVNLGGPPSKAKYDLVTDSGQYRKGKVKRTLGRE